MPMRKASIQSVRPLRRYYPGIEEGSVRVGADVYQLYGVVDAIAHEYEWGSGNAMGASKTPLDWLHYMIGMFTFRAFAGGKASWMLSYSWDGERNIDPRDAMKNLFMSKLIAGTNSWDAKGHVMSHSNDLETRQGVSSGSRNTTRRSTARACRSTPWASTSHLRRETISP